MDAPDALRRRWPSVIDVRERSAASVRAPIVRSGAVLIETLSQGGPVLIRGDGGSLAEAPRLAAASTGRSHDRDGA